MPWGGTLRWIQGQEERTTHTTLVERRSGSCHLLYTHSVNPQMKLNCRKKPSVTEPQDHPAEGRGPQVEDRGPQVEDRGPQVKVQDQRVEEAILPRGPRVQVAVVGHDGDVKVVQQVVAVMMVLFGKKIKIAVVVCFGSIKRLVK